MRTEAELRDIEANLYRWQARREPFKALAAVAAAIAVFISGVVGVSSYLSRTPQIINVHMDAPLRVEPLPAAAR